MKAFLGPLASTVARFLPEPALAQSIHDPIPELDPEAEKRRIFEAFVQVLINSMQKRAEEAPHSLETGERTVPELQPASRPTLVIIEDLHWSDETSLELLRYLARRLARAPLLLLFTYRSDEVHPALRHFLAALSREQRPAELTVTRFTPAEVDVMLRDIFELDRPVRAEFLHAIHDLTAGNPFFIEEVLKALIASGGLFCSDGAWDRKPIDELRIPHSVQDAVQRCAALLSERARHTVTVAAVAGE
jgi:predicted ATPase